MSDGVEERQHTPFKVGNLVRVLHGRETGATGVIVQIVPATRQPYVVELNNGHRTQ